jgi:hypothetical protein
MKATVLIESPRGVIGHDIQGEGQSRLPGAFLKLRQDGGADAAALPGWYKALPSSARASATTAFWRASRQGRSASVRGFITSR